MSDQPLTPIEDVNQDLGFGRRVAEHSHQRLLNRDGSFNVVRRGVPFYRSMSAFQFLLTTSWTKFQLIVAGSYFIANLIFAYAYALCGPDALTGVSANTTDQRFWEGFFFSVQTLSTIGYGALSPHSLAANVLVTIEALVGMLGFALATGLVFARFARPTVKILFSDKAVIAPFGETTAFEFRVANERNTQITQVEATVVLSLWQTSEGRRTRRFFPLSLERNRVTFLPLHWVIVHPINDLSPLRHMTPEALGAAEAEFLVVIAGIDETYSQIVHARSSYTHNEVVWRARFVDVFEPESDDDLLSIDVRRIHNIEELSG